ncbi:hypothetical protein [Mucilaginibacter aquatilis]|uniref:Uncharacterized protein n=1 Tax=Mucilaginibacter aquatilis TaxID=1517760 RepID=A0A6I4I9U8_9SPHI|nr:hypothetical protein [Mucilaginibacter aquatilis]MVN90768.1 hypothetical protein [Mucilaginibacter aquatilis]
MDMQAEHLSYFLQEDLFLLQSDKSLYQNINLNEQANDAANTQPVAQNPVNAPEASNVTVAPQTITLPATSTPVTPALTFNYLGGNQKNFLILVCYTDIDHMPAEHLNALTGTLTRINYMQDDVAILNMAKANSKLWTDISHFFKPEKLLILGKNALPAAMPALNPNEIQHTAQVKTLYTFGFGNMLGNKDYTRIFWNLIKTF